MRKYVAVVVLVAVVWFMSAFAGPLTAGAFSDSALNQGTCNAHMNGMPSVDGHIVPGLAQSPFAGGEVPGHDHVPEPPGC